MGKWIESLNEFDLDYLCGRSRHQLGVPGRRLYQRARRDHGDGIRDTFYTDPVPISDFILRDQMQRFFPEGVTNEKLHRLDGVGQGLD